MPSIVTDDGQIVTDFPVAVVQIKDSLDDAEWTNTTHLYCDKLMLAVNAYDTAELSRQIGDLVQPGTDFFAEYPTLNLLGKFVRITIPQDDPLEDIVWVGYFVGTANNRSAVKGTDPADKRLTGRKQVFSAVGLEYFLDRVQVDRAVVWEDNTIYRSIPFNGGKGTGYDVDAKVRGNRSFASDGDGIHQFVPADETGELWTLEQIVEYLLTHFQSRNTADAPCPTSFALDTTDIAANVLDGIAPTLDPSNMTVFQILNRILAPQRGFVWWLEFDETDGGVHNARVRVETITPTAITLPSLGTIPANRDPQTLDFDQQRDVDDVEIAEIGSRIYHQIIARGARMTSTCTLGKVDDATIHEIVSGWAVTPEDMAAEYNHGAADTTGYADLSEEEQGKRNDAWRKGERHYRTYSAFRIDPEWDGKSGDGADETRDWSFPVLSATGSIVSGLPFAVNGLRMLNHTRLKRGWNYEDTADIVETTPEGTEAEYMPLFAIMQVAIANESAEPPQHDKYQFVEKLSQHDFVEGDLVSDTITVSYSVHTQQTVPGVILNAAGVQHACALNHWSGAEPTETEPQVDYETLRVTATIEADTYCDAQYPLDADLPADIPLQKLLLYVGDEYRLDFLAANTVVDLENGEPVLTTGGILRDDRKRLKDIARAAYEWYSTDHRPLTVNFRQLSNRFRLGMLITTIGVGTVQETINTVVSMITYNFENGVTTIKTHDTGLDLVKVV